MAKIRNRFTDKELKEIAKVLHSCFNLVDEKRIYELILQVDSIDSALRLLIFHREGEDTIDRLVYEYLHYKDNKSC